MGDGDHPFAKIESTFKKSVGALQTAQIPFLLGGSLASWARGGPETRNDLDFIVKPDDAQPAVDALVEAGLEPEDPPEDWLLKAWDGEVLVDIIFGPLGLEVDDDLIARGEMIDVLAMRVPVMALEDVLVSKLLALNDHSLDYESVMQMARALRERIDWSQVRSRTAHWPYAKAFFTLIEELGILDPAPRHDAGRAHVRVVS